MSDHEVICLSDSDHDDDDDVKIQSSNNKENINVSIPKSSEEEVQIVEAAPAKMIPLHASASSLNSDDELEIVGSKNTTRLPHSRHDCLSCRYCPVTDLTQLTLLTATTCSTTNGNNGDKDNGGRRENRKYCSLCYCYVCDRKAEECTNWFLGGRGELVPDDDDAGTVGGGAAAAGPLKSVEDNDNDSNSKSNKSACLKDSSAATTTAASTDASSNTDQYKPHKNHCQATDKGPLKSFWYNMRIAVREGRDPSTITTNTTSRSRSSIDDDMQRYMENYGHTLQAAMATVRSRSRSSTARRSTSSRRRARSQPPPPPSSQQRRRTRPRNGSLTPSDHRDRIRAQNMLEALYQNPDSWS